MSDIHSKIEGSIRAGIEFLEQNCSALKGFQTDATGDSRQALRPNHFPESIFENMLALDLLQEQLSERTKNILTRYITPIRRPEQAIRSEKEGLVYAGILNFFKRKPLIPDDTEVTALYHYICLRDGLLSYNDHRISDVVRVLILNVNQHGCIRMYFPPMVPHREDLCDPGSLANVLRFLYLCEIDQRLFQKSEDYLYDWLVSEKYLNGARYYHSAQTFLYFCAEAVTKDDRALKRFRTPLMAQLEVRMDHLLQLPKDNQLPLDFACCILAVACLSLSNSKEDKNMNTVKKVGSVLQEMQHAGNKTKEVHGSWPADSLYKQGRSCVYLGGAHVSSIFALAALSKLQNLLKYE